MNSRYEGYSPTRLLAEVGDKKKAVEIYLQLHPEEDAEQVKEGFDLEEAERKLSVFDLYCIGGRMTDGYDENDAVRQYLEMHLEANEADVRAEFKRASEEKDARRSRPFDPNDQTDDEGYDRPLSIFDLYRVGVHCVAGYDQNKAIAEYMEMHPESKEAEVRAELERALKANQGGSE